MSAAAQTPTTLTAETQLILHIASGVPVLCRLMGIIKAAGETPGKVKVGLVAVKRSWLCPTIQGGVPMLEFRPDMFAQRLGTASGGERHAMLWLLNVWNPHYAKSNGWTFDLFEAFSSLDSDNIVGIAEWIINPRWP